MEKTAPVGSGTTEKESEISPLLSILNYKFVHELRTQEKQTTWF